MLWCARAARPAQPVHGARPSRFPASVGSPTCNVAPLTATSICTNASSTAQTRSISSGFMVSPLVKERPLSPIVYKCVVDFGKKQAQDRTAAPADAVRDKYEPQEGKHRDLEREQARQQSRHARNARPAKNPSPFGFSPRSSALPGGASESLAPRGDGDAPARELVD